MSEMWSPKSEARARQVWAKLKKTKWLAQYVDASLELPQPYRGKGRIKLIVLGQDPTVKDVQARRNIHTVLNLDKKRSVTAYLSAVCAGLGIRLAENVYATNFYKNFFIAPPTQIRDIDVFKEYSPAWLPVLLEELAEFPDLPVIALGEPILPSLVLGSELPRVKHFWGYVPEWKTQKILPFGHLEPAENKLGRAIFPFPQQPTLRKEFYTAIMDKYIAYVKAQAFK